MDKSTEPLFIDETEASRRYGMSVGWFRYQRWLGVGPRYAKMTKSHRGGVRYSVKALNEFFNDRLVSTNNAKKYAL